MLRSCRSIAAAVTNSTTMNVFKTTTSGEATVGHPKQKARGKTPVPPKNGVYCFGFGFLLTAGFFGAADAGFSLPPISDSASAALNGNWRTED